MASLPSGLHFFTVDHLSASPGPERAVPAGLGVTLLWDLTAVSRRNPGQGFVTLRQTFVRRCHGVTIAPVGGSRMSNGTSSAREV